MSFSILDMQLHTTDPKEITAIDVFEKSILEKLTPYPLLSETCASVSFGHIFSGGYAAGYYSYKWAEVLDADAFSYFEEKGIFNHEVATKFRENILEKGSSEDPMELFKKFRGREPDVNHLLKRAGLL
jgi:peptidyl-dipeptidase Dcp